MSGVGRHHHARHVVQQMNEKQVPLLHSSTECLARCLECRGNNLWKVEYWRPNATKETKKTHFSPDDEEYEKNNDALFPIALAKLSRRLHKVIWLQRGDLVVLESVSDDISQTGVSAECCSEALKETPISVRSRNTNVTLDASNFHLNGSSFHPPFSTQSCHVETECNSEQVDVVRESYSNSDADRSNKDSSSGKKRRARNFGDSGFTSSFAETSQARSCSVLAEHKHDASQVECAFSNGSKFSFFITRKLSLVQRKTLRKEAISYRTDVSSEIRGSEGQTTLKYTSSPFLLQIQKQTHAVPPPCADTLPHSKFISASANINTSHDTDLGVTSLLHFLSLGCFDNCDSRTLSQDPKYPTTTHNMSLQMGNRSMGWDLDTSSSPSENEEEDKVFLD